MAIWLWYIPVIAAFRTQGWECQELEASTGCTIRTFLQNKAKQDKQAKYPK